MLLLFISPLIRNRNRRIARVIIQSPDFSPPAEIPRRIKQIAHTLDGHTLGLWHPDAQDDQAAATDDRPEQIRAPDVQRDEHVGRDADDGELEEPVQRHANRIADVADPRGKDLRPVDEGHRAEADGPANGVDEDGGNSCVGGGFVIRGAGLQTHVGAHVDVRGQLQPEACQGAAASAQVVDKAPSEGESESEFDNTVGARRDQGVVVGYTGVLENIRDVVRDPIATRPLRDCLHGHEEPEALAIVRV